MAEEDTEKAGWFEKGRCAMPINVQFWRKSDCCCAEVNLSTLTCWGYYHILNIGDSLTTNMLFITYAELNQVYQEDHTEDNNIINIDRQPLAGILTTNTTTKHLFVYNTSININKLKNIIQYRHNIHLCQADLSMISQYEAYQPIGSLLYLISSTPTIGCLTHYPAYTSASPPKKQQQILHQQGKKNEAQKKLSSFMQCVHIKMFIIYNLVIQYAKSHNCTLLNIAYVTPLSL